VPAKDAEAVLVDEAQMENGIRKRLNNAA